MAYLNCIFSYRIVVVKYHNLEDAVKAREGLQSEGYQTSYVATKCNSEQAHHHTLKTETDDQAARLTLNLFKIKENSQIVNENQEDFFGLACGVGKKRKQDEVENVFMIRSNDSLSQMRAENHI